MRSSGVEDDAVAGFEGREQTEEDAAGGDAADFPQIDAAFFAEAGVDKALVVDAAKPAGMKAAGKGHFEVVAGLGGRLGDGAVQGAAINLGDVGDVFGGFEAAFDFEGGDAGAEEIGQDLQTGQILRA